MQKLFLSTVPAACQINQSIAALGSQLSIAMTNVSIRLSKFPVSNLCMH